MYNTNCNDVTIHYNVIIVILGIWMSNHSFAIQIITFILAYFNRASYQAMQHMLVS